jgi:anti-sigma factor RsiW
MDMSLDHEVIRTVLPDYMNNLLSNEMKKAVTEHLALCPECAAELRLLEELATVDVPDPGDLFWQTLPKRVVASIERPIPWWKSMMGRLLRPASFTWISACLCAIVLILMVVKYENLWEYKDNEAVVEQVERVDIPRQTVQEIAGYVASGGEGVLPLIENEETALLEDQQTIAALSAEELDELIRALQESHDAGGDA